jgi:hypothetical protein
MGRRYEPSEWVEFLTEPAEPSPATLAIARRFEVEAWALFTRWAEACAVELDDDVTAPRLAFNTLCSIVGHGVGLWDGELLPEAEGRSFEATAKADAALVRLAHDLDACMSDDQLNTEEA